MSKKRCLPSQFRLNDPDRRPFHSAEDQRLNYLLDIADSLDGMNGGRGLTRRHSLTTETRQAMCQTLRGLVFLVKQLLERGCGYIMLGMFQSDDLEGEFGALRQMSGGCYYVSVEQVLCSSRFRQLKLYGDIVDHVDDVLHTRAPCCDQPLSESEWEIIDDCPSLVSEISAEEKSSIYYIAGFIAHSEGIQSETQSADIQTAESEFTRLVSRGRLAHPLNGSIPSHRFATLSSKTPSPHHHALIDLCPHSLRLVKPILLTFLTSKLLFAAD